MTTDEAMRKRAAEAAAMARPPPALRRNYTVCGLLHDRAQDARDRELAHALGYKFALLDAADGTVRECSAPLAAALGVPAHRLCGERLADWVEDAVDAAAVRAALASGGALSRALTLRGVDGAPGVRGELSMPVDDVRLGDARAWRLCLALDGAAGGAGDAELQLQRLATSLRLPVPVAPALRAALDRLQRTFIVTDPSMDDNPIVFASEARAARRAARAARAAAAHARAAAATGACARRPQAFCAMTGYDRADLVGRNCRLLQGPGTDLSVVRQVRAAVRHGGSCTAELLNYKRDGTAFTNLLHFAPVRGPTGGVAYFVGVQTDLGEVRAAPPPPLAAATAACDASSPLSAASSAVGGVGGVGGGDDVGAHAQQVGVPLPADVRDAVSSVDSALSQHLREMLKSSLLMHSLG